MSSSFERIRAGDLEADRVYEREMAALRAASTFRGWAIKREFGWKAWGLAVVAGLLHGGPITLESWKVER